MGKILGKEDRHWGGFVSAAVLGCVSCDYVQRDG